MNRRLTGKVPDAGKDRGQKEKRALEDGCQESGTVLGAWEQTGFSEKVKRAGMALRRGGWRTAEDRSSTPRFPTGRLA